MKNCLQCSSAGKKRIFSITQASHFCSVCTFPLFCGNIVNKETVEYCFQHQILIILRHCYRKILFPLNSSSTFSFQSYLSHNHHIFFVTKFIESVISGRCFSTLICFSLFEWARIYNSFTCISRFSKQFSRTFMKSGFQTFLENVSWCVWRATACRTVFLKSSCFVAIVGIITYILPFSKTFRNIYKRLYLYTVLVIQKSYKGNTVVIAGRTKYLEGIKSILSESSKFLMKKISG